MLILSVGPNELDFSLHTPKCIVVKFALYGKYCYDMSVSPNSLAFITTDIRKANEENTGFEFRIIPESDLPAYVKAWSTLLKWDSYGKDTFSLQVSSQENTHDYMIGMFLIFTRVVEFND